MQEFSSVTASSYDADSLAPLLTEKSADGWEVVSIVTAGTNIVAYLQRESDGTAAPTVDVATDDTAIDDAGDATTDVGSAAAAGAAVAMAEEAVTSDAGSDVVDEPAGWAVAPESESDATETDAAATDESLAELVADVEAADTAEAAPTLADTTATDTPATAEAPAAEAPAAEAPAAEAPAAESTVPAGWYADPSGRFELRYWDGSAWTEHVSRAGQQFTDPPVA